MPHRFPINKPVEAIERQVSFVKATMKSLIVSLGIFLAILNFQDCQGYPTHHLNLRGHHHIQQRRSISEEKEFEKYLKKQNITDINSIKDEKKILKIVKEFFTKKLLTATNETEQPVSEKRARRNLVEKNGCLCSDKKNTPEVDKILLDCAQSLTNSKKTCDLNKLKKKLSTCPKKSKKKPNQTDDSDESKTDSDLDYQGDEEENDNESKDKDIKDEDGKGVKSKKKNKPKDDDQAANDFPEPTTKKNLSPDQEPKTKQHKNVPNSPEDEESDPDSDQPENCFEKINWQELLDQICKELKSKICEKECSDQTKAKRDAMQEEQDYSEKTSTASSIFASNSEKKINREDTIINKFKTNNSQSDTLEKGHNTVPSVKDQIERKSEPSRYKIPQEISNKTVNSHIQKINDYSQKMPGVRPESNSTFKPHKI